VRRRQRPLLAGLLIASGITSAVPVAAALVLLLRLVHRTIAELISTDTDDLLSNVATLAVLAVLAVACVAEWAWITHGVPRPLAVNRQVPQSWGHDHGPWKAAVRYGLRLGVGPATILSSWSWWAGALISAWDGWSTAVWFSIVFVVGRTIAMLLIAGNPADGLVLAKRMSRVRAAEGRSQLVGLMVMGAAIVLAGLGQM
jgi:hypothetical protein